MTPRDASKYREVMTTSSRQQPDRNLAMELVRATESACLAAARWVGRGDKNAADNAAVEAMRLSLSTVSLDGVVVIGEGGRDRGGVGAALATAARAARSWS